MFSNSIITLNNNPILYSLVFKEGGFHTQTLDAETKNRIASFFIPLSELEPTSCSKYSDFISKTKSISEYACGIFDSLPFDHTTNTINDTESFTIAFSEEALKKSVEQIFGKDRYEQTDMITPGFGMEQYCYHEKSKEYFYTSGQIGGTLVGKVTTTLLKAEKKKKAIVLTIKSTYESTETKIKTLQYYFEKENGTYHFEEAKEIVS